MTTTPEETPQKRGFHHRIYPYMEEFVQYANEQDDGTEPWIVRDRSTALRNERQGRGKALVRVWVPTDWTLVNELEDRDE
jgi:hypothetical protein